MTKRHSIFGLCIVLSLGAALVGSALASPAGTASLPVLSSDPTVRLAPATTPVSPTFTYQGQLKKSGAPVNDNACSMTFSLWDAPSGGAQLGVAQVVNPVPVANGLFTVQLNGANAFGANAFTGEARWLQTAVQCTGDGSATTLSRQRLTATPYAHGLRPGALVSGTLVSGPIFSANNASSDAIAGASSAGYGVTGFSQNGYAGIYGTSSNNYGIFGAITGPQPRAGVYGKNDGTGFGVFGQNTISGTGVFGLSASGAGVDGYSNDGYGTTGGTKNGYAGVYGTSDNNYGVFGVINGPQPRAGIYGKNDGTGFGVFGQDTTSGTAVFGLSSGGSGVDGSSGSAYGVTGESQTGYAGVYGTSASNYGVYGWINGAEPRAGVNGNNDGSGFGVFGQSTYGTGVFGLSHVITRAAVTGINDGGGYGAFFSGTVLVNGNMTVTGNIVGAVKNFMIDHPLDPANRYLMHTSVESPDMMNIYNGNVTTDGNGDASVALPVYFEALNSDYRYQLTVIGTFAQAIISAEIQDNRFSIKTDKPDVKVSWQVTGIRRDPYANQNRNPVEADKPAGERGKYLYPQAYGLPDTMGIGYEPVPH